MENRTYLYIMYVWIKLTESQFMVHDGMFFHGIAIDFIVTMLIKFRV